ncbi:MAG TPA: tetratricopeptide repeat protein, partial [Planctomycetaceae bacterium]|nr:tetratricopeptide repeat protein [Planctomycetaceae bacterium]
IAQYNEAIRIDPDDADAYNNRGIAYINMGEVSRAIADYNEAIRINPDYALAYYNRGHAYGEKKEYDKAIADYSDAIRINPDYAAAYNNRGSAYYKVGDVDKAIADYTEAIRINPDYAAAYVNRGIAYRNVGKVSRSIADYTKAIRLDPTAADATPQFVVNTTSDTVDADPGDGVAQDSQGKTSLRAAIMEANALEGRDLILLPQGTFTLSIAGVGEANSATGDLDIKSDMTIVGAGSRSTIINGNLLDRVLDISGNVSLSGLTVTGGRPPGPRQPGNGYGGGVAISKGTVTMDEVTVSGNHGAFGTGGIVVAGATLILTDSTISGNTTPYEGGGIAVHSGGTANIINSTISDNRADNGAGIAASGDGTLITITNCTITGNSAKFGGGGLKINGGTARLQNTIVSSNTAGSGPDIYGTVQSLGNNLVRKTIGATGLVSSDLKNVNPTLGPLDDNGGTTLTHALLDGSPAIDAGNNSAAPATDQRGISRPIDGDSNGTNIVDIGATEFKPKQ